MVEIEEEDGGSSLFSSKPKTFTMECHSSQASSLKASVLHKLLDFFDNYTDDDLTEAAEVASGQSKRRTFRKFSFRGVDLDQLLNMSTEDLVKIFHACIVEERSEEKDDDFDQEAAQGLVAKKIYSTIRSVANDPHTLMYYYLFVVAYMKDLMDFNKTQHDELEANFFEERATLEAKYQALYQPLYTKVAIKQLRLGSRQGEREFKAEVETISRVHHRHLVSLVGYCAQEERRLLVYEFVPNGTLASHLHSTGRPPMEWSNRMKVALGSAKGLAYLHEDCIPRIIHRDVKAPNILVDYNFEAKVADFGLAKIAAEFETHVSTRIMGTIGYLAPEYSSTGKLTEKSDVFSYGVVLLELITGKRPVITMQDRTESLVDWVNPYLTRAIESNNYEEIVDPRLEHNYDDDEMSRLIECAAACIRHFARKRPKMSQIVRVIEGGVSMDELHQGVRPGHSGMYSSSSPRSSESGEYVVRHRRTFGIQQGSSDYSPSDSSMAYSGEGRRL